MSEWPILRFLLPLLAHSLRCEIPLENCRFHRCKGLRDLERRRGQRRVQNTESAVMYPSRIASTRRKEIFLFGVRTGMAEVGHRSTAATVQGFPSRLPGRATPKSFRIV